MVYRRRRVVMVNRGRRVVMVGRGEVMPMMPMVAMMAMMAMMMVMIWQKVLSLMVDNVGLMCQMSCGTVVAVLGLLQNR